MSVAARGTSADPDACSPTAARWLCRCPFRHKPARVIQGTGHNTYAARRCGRLTEQPGATIRTEAATDNAAAIADDFVVFNLAGNLNRANRDKNRRGKCAARRALAIAAVAIPHSNRVGPAFVTDGPAHTAAGKTCRHQESPFRVTFRAISSCRQHPRECHAAQNSSAKRIAGFLRSCRRS